MSGGRTEPGIVGPVVGASVGNFATLSADGQITDSGKNARALDRHGRRQRRVDHGGGPL